MSGRSTTVDRRRIPRVALGALVLAFVATIGCGGSTEEPEAAQAPIEAPTEQAAGEILPFPFTAEQIRDAMPEGLVIDMVIVGPGTDGEMKQRWTVVSADEVGVEIEYSMVISDGPEPPSTTQKATWAELRDHATFSVDNATRERSTITTALGELEGWSYVVNDAATGSVTEMFFADDYPGSPVEYRLRKGDEILQEVRQLAQTRP